MPDVQIHGRFAVITSSTEYRKAPSRKGWKRIAIVEIDPNLKPPSRIDPRIKSLKRIITISDDFGTWLSPGKFMFEREWKLFNEKAKRWNMMYPLHIVARDWPHPLPVYSE